MKLALFLRFVAAFMAITVLTNILYPTVTFALSFNMFQPEFTSYGNSGSNQMVNPLTGDFNLTLPMVELPGTEGGFSMPITYNPVPSPEQEASWVGLGWNMNAGAIMRSPSSTPDDFNGEPTNMNISSDGVSGSSYSLIVPFVTYNWGHIGNSNFSGGYVWFPILFNVGFGDYSENGTILEFIKYDKEDTYVDPVGLAMLVVDVALTVATLGGYAGAKLIAQIAIQTAIAVAAQTVASWVASSLAKSYSGMQSNQSMGMYIPSISSSGCRNSVFYKECDFVQGKIDFNTNKNAFGTLYLQNQTKEDIGARGSVKKTDGTYVKAYADNVAGDAYRYINNNDFSAVNTPTSLAYDRFSVMGEGIGGVIQPYRLETVSSASDYIMQNKTHKRMIVASPDVNYKVPFRYTGELANHYTHHQGKRSNNQNIKLDDANPSGIAISNDGSSFPLVISEEDVNLSLQRKEGDRDGLYSQKYDNKDFTFLAQGKHVQWYSNQEVLDMTNPAKHDALNNKNYMLDAGFVDWLSGVKSSGTTISARTNFRTNLPQNGIGAFSITREDGTTYHYALPVYNKKIQTEAITNNKVKTDPNSNTLTPVDIKTTSVVEPDFAVNWLLTAITGPDFIDRGESGYIDENDWGSWTKFEYGNFANDYTWRAPYSGYSYSGTTRQYSLGNCQTYYLNSIRNRTHVALFEKSYRYDAHSSDQNTTAQVSSALKLDNVYILDNENYRKLQLQGLSTINNSVQNNELANNDTYSQVYDNYDIEPFRDQIDRYAIQKIAFNYDYSLCQGIPNSFLNPKTKVLPAVGSRGKLTLKTISVMGRNNFKYAGDYNFTYSSNPDYDMNKWDGWGLYSSFADGQNSRTPVSVSADLDMAAWAMTKMAMPRGTNLEVKYESDRYTEICGTPVSEYYLGTSEKFGGGYRVKSIIQTEDLNGTTKVSDYVYENGVASTEPEFISRHFYAQLDVSQDTKTKYGRFQNFYDFPFTPVMYKKVTVSTGNGTKSLGSVEYNYFTPDFDKILSLDQKLGQQITPFKVGKFTADELGILNGIFERSPIVGIEFPSREASTYYSEITDKTAYIGQVKSILKRNQNNDKTEETIYNFAEAWKDDLGVFTEGILQGDLVSTDINNKLKIHKTVKKSIPVYIASITSKDHRYGIERTLTLKDLDPVTGVTTASATTDSYGNTLLTQIDLAYKHYAAMGPKAQDITNKNMLSQQSGQYVFKYPGTDDSKKVMVNAEVSTWSNATAVYDFSTNKQISQGSSWRRGSTYLWVGKPNDILDKNGNYPISSFVSFDWNNLVANESKGWQKTEEVKLYDPYSHLLTNQDISGQYASTKMDYRHRLPLVTGSHSTQDEIAFSGSEYFYGNNSLEGGINRVDGVPTTQFAHTGEFSLKVPKSKTGFQYTIPGNSVNTKRKYRASVWAYLPGTSERDLTSLQFNYSISNSIKGVAKGNASFKSGSWYLYNLDILPDGNKDIVISCVNQAYRDIYLDDFRVHPLDAPVQSYVYDPETFALTAQLNADNLYIRYEYDDIGRPLRIFQERFGLTERLLQQKNYHIK